MNHSLLAIGSGLSYKFMRREGMCSGGNNKLVGGRGRGGKRDDVQ